MFRIAVVIQLLDEERQAMREESLREEKQPCENHKKAQLLIIYTASHFYLTMASSGKEEL